MSRIRGTYTDGYNRVKRWGDDPPRTMAIEEEEGGPWLPFVRGMPMPGKVHAIMFEDGRVWDAVNGWRAEHNGAQATDADAV
jgi:hypothetical protein